MLMRKKGLPEVDELVICRITKLHPNSAFAELLEYEASGMIHVSEVAKRWVRDIREFVRENSLVVCRVMRVEGSQLSLSIKRVAHEQANSRLNEFNRERKAEKMLELAGKELGKTLEQSYSEVGLMLQDSFGSLTKSFELALKDPEFMRTKGVPDEWVKALSAVAVKSKVEKEFVVKAGLRLVSYEPEGVNVIKEALRKAEAEGLEVRYISAPKYIVVGRGMNHREVREKVGRVAGDIARQVRQKNGIGEFEVDEE